MLDQIVKNSVGLTPEDQVERVARHLRGFWTPAMVDELAQAVSTGAVTLSPPAAAAVAELTAGAPSAAS
ncbi:MAG: formate dehydrogenase subunit delta [Actinomycetes bacterium]